MSHPAANPLIRFAPWTLVLCLALVTVWLAAQNFSLRTENRAQRTERILAEVAYQTGQSVLAERTLLAENLINQLGRQLRHSEDLARLIVTTLTSPTGNTAVGSAIVVWDPEQQIGLLTSEKLPAAAETDNYRVWVLDSTHSDPVNAGALFVAGDSKATLVFKPAQPVTHATGFAISLERRGSVPQPDGPFVLLGK